jgi:hypothetical protein
LVELHGGTIQAVSPGAGQGATFTVQLPLAVVHARSDRRASFIDQRMGGSDTELDGIRVLAVDDQRIRVSW